MSHLPNNTTLTTARKNKAALLGSLSEQEQELLLIAENTNNSIFGGQGNRKHNHVLVTVNHVTKKLDKAGRCRTKVTETHERVQGGQAIVDSLVKRGWMRFAPGLTDDLGYYLLTISAEKVFSACREGKSPLLSK
jgi:hypothetical protein